MIHWLVEFTANMEVLKSRRKVVYCAIETTSQVKCGECRRKMVNGMIENIIIQIFFTFFCFIVCDRKIEEGVREVVNGFIKADATFQVENIGGKVVNVMGELVTQPQVREA